MYNTSASFNFVLKDIYFDSSFGRKSGSGVKYQFNEPKGIYADIKKDHERLAVILRPRFGEHNLAVWNQGRNVHEL